MTEYYPHAGVVQESLRHVSAAKRGLVMAGLQPALSCGSEHTEVKYMSLFGEGAGVQLDLLATGRNAIIDVLNEALIQQLETLGIDRNTDIIGFLNALGTWTMRSGDSVAPVHMEIRERDHHKEIAVFDPRTKSSRPLMDSHRNESLFAPVEVIKGLHTLHEAQVQHERESMPRYITPPQSERPEGDPMSMLKFCQRLMQRCSVAIQRVDTRVDNIDNWGDIDPGSGYPHISSLQISNIINTLFMDILDMFEAENPATGIQSVPYHSSKDVMRYIMDMSDYPTSYRHVFRELINMVNQLPKKYKKFLNPGMKRWYELFAQLNNAKRGGYFIFSLFPPFSCTNTDTNRVWPEGYEFIIDFCTDYKEFEKKERGK